MLNRKELAALVMWWQRGHDITADGIIGQETLESIRSSMEEEAPEVDGGQPVWPMLSVDGSNPVISDGFGLTKRNGKGHLGVDIMFRREKSGFENRPEYTKHYWCPSKRAVIVSCMPGTIHSIKLSEKNGWVIKINHEGQIRSVYRHMNSVEGLLPGEDVSSGTPIGIAGHAPSAGKRGINHLHFELWDMSKKGGDSNRRLHSFDPESMMEEWAKG